MKELVGYDERGKVTDLGSVILRTVQDDYKQEVKEIFKIYQDSELNKKGIVATTLLTDGNLEHSKFVISYPYEWPAEMYKDAVLFHLSLFLELEKVGLTLKDALPNNIVFDSTRPVFVDFLSLIFPDKLKDEKWLGTDKFSDPRFATVDSMLLPYMIIPFFFMLKKEYGTAREMLSMRSCNTEGTIPAWDELLNVKELIGQRGKVFNLYKLSAGLLWHRRILKQHKAGFSKFIRKLIKIVHDTDITPSRSPYAYYYDEKKEESSFEDPSGFLAKQRSVYEILNARRPKTVLDIGANTGWYSVLANKLEASVISLEEDESCVNILYGRAKKNNLNILPLKVSFSEITKEIFSVQSTDPVYEGKGFGVTPLYRAGIERFNSELVLVLGLTHHLILGEGNSIERVFEILSTLTLSTLVVEFVDLDDNKIVDEPLFFRNISKFDKSNYNLDKFLEVGKNYFASVEIRDSNPETRKILVFDKNPQNRY